MLLIQKKKIAGIRNEEVSRISNSLSSVASSFNSRNTSKIMSFRDNFSKITNFVFVFGISPHKFNRKANKFECTAFSLAYSLIYFFIISFPLIYGSIGHHLKDGTTASILSIIKFSTVMTIFYLTMINLLLNRHTHANYLNQLLKVASNLAELNIKLDYGFLLFVHWQHICFVILSAAFYAIDVVILRRELLTTYGTWYTFHFFQSTTLAMVTFYIRCLAIVLYRSGKSILEHLDNKVRNDLAWNKWNEDKLVDLMNCFKAFDELAYLKKQLSELFGILLLLTSAVDFIIVTIAVYELLYYARPMQALNLYYFAAFSLPHVMKSVLLVETLDILAEQVRFTKCARGK